MKLLINTHKTLAVRVFIIKT